MQPYRTYVYIDGFNLYYRAVRGTPYKWLDFKAMVSHLLGSQNDIRAIKYFTAIVSGRLDPHQPIRQETYIRALKAYIPEISIYYGNFLSHEVNAPVANSNPLRFTRIIKTEEKGSDVNLAVHLLNDAWLDHYDCAVVISNDSDLAEALKIVTRQLGKQIGIISPVNRPSKELIQYATFIKRIRKGVLSVSQLPDPIPNTHIHKPSTW
ncbi:MAG TPA: NYN domain-containing protein [Syntrophales bacterium]|nr:NYN domain-containing protein [Syntrophales bacterium]